jgi:hypothetical protein
LTHPRRNSIDISILSTILQLYSEISLIFLFVRWDFCYCGHYWPIVPATDDRWWWLSRNWWNKDWQGKPKYSIKTCPTSNLSTTNSSWLDPGLNPGRRGGKPATNRLSYGAALSHLARSCEYSNESVGPVGSQEPPDQLCGYKLLKKGSYFSQLASYLYCGGVGKEMLNNVKSRDLYILPAFKLFQKMKSSDRNGLFSNNSSEINS